MMKKKITITAALILALALVLCSCGQQKEFDYSGPFTQDGYWKNITASEYVTLPDLDNIVIKQSDVNAEIDELLEQYKYDLQIMDGEIKDTDTVNIDYVGSIDGVEFEGGSTDGKGTEVNIATTNYIEGFLPQLVGHKPGETFDINVTFPADYGNASLAGKDAVFKITVNYILGSVKGEWNDSFINEKLKSEYGWTTTAQAEAEIRHSLIDEYLYENSTFEKDVPDVMMDYQRGSTIDYYKSYADAYNMSVDDFLKYYLGVNGTDELWERSKENAAVSAKHYLIYQAIAEKTGYKVTEDEIKEYFLDLNGSEDYSSIQERVGLPYIKYMVTCENVIKKLAVNVKLSK